LSNQSRLVEYGDGKTAFAIDVYGSSEIGGTVYDALADKRSWIAMKNFLKEKLEFPEKA
jgi:hypothetical protein